jgi:predicted nucleic acid-binding protein
MSRWVIDASLALQWFLEDESERAYSLSILARLEDSEAVVPILWFYEVGNGLTMAHRRKRITLDQIIDFIRRGEALPIQVGGQETGTILQLTRLAQAHGLTSYEAAYLDLAARLRLPLATTDKSLRRAAQAVGVEMVAP